ncbi:MAG: hypothetical protein NVSMB25_14950 [Thermoleophilaceae bacterium]
MSLALLIAICVVAVAVAGSAIVWLLGYPAQGLDPLRASATEAGERAADAAADFIDWVRRGR